VCDKPKRLNEYYFVCTASDGYKAIFSWNELFNSELGEKIFIITEMNGIRLKQLRNRILLISTFDLKVGRRYIKGLQYIEINRAD